MYTYTSSFFHTPWCDKNCCCYKVKVHSFNFLSVILLRIKVYIIHSILVTPCLDLSDKEVVIFSQLQYPGITF